MKRYLIILLVFSTIIFCQQSVITKIIGAELKETDSLTIPEITKESLANVTSFLYRNYPLLAVKSGVSGKIILTLRCLKDGNVSDLRIRLEKPADMGFGETGINASKFLKYTPAKLNGAPVETEISQYIKFNTGMYSKSNNGATFRIREL